MLELCEVIKMLFLKEKNHKFRGYELTVLKKRERKILSLLILFHIILWALFFLRLLFWTVTKRDIYKALIWFYFNMKSAK